MNIFISLKLTQRIGVWFELDLSKWKIRKYNYVSVCEGRCRSVVLGPLSFGCNLPDAKGEKERQEEMERVMELLNGGTSK